MNGRGSESGHFMKATVSRGHVAEGESERGDSMHLSKDAAWLKGISRASRETFVTERPHSSGVEFSNGREPQARGGGNSSFVRTRSEPQSPNSPNSPSSPIRPSAQGFDLSPRRHVADNSRVMLEANQQRLSPLSRENSANFSVDAERSENLSHRPAGEPVAMASLSYLQVHLLGFVVVFTASGLVRMEDLAFVAFASAYSAALGFFIFPTTRRVLSPPSRLDNSSTFQVYQFVGALIGLFLPLMYVLGGFSRSDHLASSGATPHLFLLASQILSENVLASWPWVSLPARVVLAIMYNVRRLFTLVSWLRMAKDALSTTGSVTTAAANWSVFGQVLAQLNLLYWSFHLFVYLVPFCLPVAFTGYMGTEQAPKAEAVDDDGKGPNKFSMAALRHS